MAYRCKTAPCHCRTSLPSPEPSLRPAAHARAGKQKSAQRALFACLAETESAMMTFKDDQRHTKNNSKSLFFIELASNGVQKPPTEKSM